MKKGVVLSKGIGYGYAYNFEYETDISSVNDLSLDSIVKNVKSELENVYGDTEDITEEEAMIFEAHMTLLDDCNFLDGIRELQNQGMGLSQAIMENGKKNAFVFLNMEDKALSHIAEDIMDITYQMLDVLKESSSNMQLKEPVVLCCDNIYPSSLLNFISKYKVAAILTKESSELSHSVIIARAAQIPMITNVDVEVKNKMPIIVNGDDNEIICNPNYQKMMEIKRAPEKKESELLKLDIDLKANAGDLDEVLKISKSSNVAIGLFRSEYFYLSANQMPTDEEAFDFVNEIFLSFNDRFMDYRLPDFGRDKLPQYLENTKELNGIEYLIDNNEILRQQIYAIKKSENLVNKRILLSYVRNSEVIDFVKKLLEPVQVELGSMIETRLPEDVLTDVILKSDFINIGTNDMLCDFSGDNRTSYSNTDSKYTDQMFNYIKKITKIAHDYGKRVCICGEIAADEKYHKMILDSGVDSISVSSFHILNK